MTVLLTKAQWYAEIKTCVPAWFWEKEVNSKAWAMALAAVAEQLQIVVGKHFTDTMIMQSAAGVLDSHGYERSTTRLDQEVDPDYAVRVQNLFNQSNIPALVALINKILVAGTARIEEDFNSVPFCSREFFCNRAALFLADPLVNGFSVVVDKQVHAPFSYLDREYFASREAFAGTSISLDRVFTLIKKITDDNKAGGTVYRIYELLS